MNPLSNCSFAEFGSHVRKDNDSHSDRDLLIVYPARQFPRAALGLLRAAGASCSVYSRQRLSRLAHEGSLFIKHLVDESHILRDSDGFLASLLADFTLRGSYTHVFDDAMRIFGLVETIPQHVNGISWATDIVAVGFRAMAIPFLADRGIFAFGMKDMCDSLVRLGRINAADVEPLAALREFKSAYRRSGTTGCTSAQLTEIISIIDRCFSIGVHRRFRRQRDMLIALEQNPTDEWYRGLRLLEATMLPMSRMKNPRIDAIQKMIRSPQAYGWQMKHRHREIVTTITTYFAGLNVDAA